MLRIRDVYPGSGILIFYPSRIPNPKTSTKEKGENCIHTRTFFGATNFTIGFQRITELFTQKFVTKLLRTRVWDPRSGIHLFRIPDPGPGVKKAPDPGSLIRIRNSNTDNYYVLFLGYPPPHRTSMELWKNKLQGSISVLVNEKNLWG